MAIEAYSTEVINVIETEPIIPNKAVCQVKYLKVGRKLGADAKSKARHAKLIPKQASRQKIVSKGAIAFNEPINKINYKLLMSEILSMKKIENNFKGCT